MTTNKTQYVKYLQHCPKCGRFGGLYALFTKNNSEKEYGPYFYVMHHKTVFSKEKYAENRANGVSPNDARGSKSGKVKESWKCYIGKSTEFEGFMSS